MTGIAHTDGLLSSVEKVTHPYGSCDNHACKLNGGTEHLGYDGAYTLD